MNGVNVADCWLFPQGTTAVEMTLAITNATQVRRGISSTFQAFRSLVLPNSWFGN